MTATPQPLVSVVLITHNCVKYLEKAITSVLAQSWTNVELIIVDDGSTDKTRALVEKFTDARLSYVRQENAGPNFARNHGIRRSRGDVIAFLDCDDWWLPEKVERQLALLRKNSRVGLVYSLAIRVDTRGVETERFGSALDGRLLDRLLLGNCISGSASSAMITREAMETVGLFDESLQFGEDWEYWIRIAAAFDVGCVPQFDVYLLSRKGSRGKQPQLLLDNGLRIVQANLKRFYPRRFWLRRKALAQCHYLASHDFFSLGFPHQARRAIVNAIVSDPFRLHYYMRLARLLIPPFGGPVPEAATPADSA